MASVHWRTKVFDVRVWLRALVAIHVATRNRSIYTSGRIENAETNTHSAELAAGPLQAPRNEVVLRCGEL